MELNTLIVTEEENIAIIGINRPDKLNALNILLINELEYIINDLISKDEIRCIIITGSGEKAFAAGADIKEINSLNEVSAFEFSQKGSKLFTLISESSKPVICAVNGYALGGGCELALACHIRIASDNAQFGLPEVNLGLIPGYGGTQRLPLIVGCAKAAELMLTGEPIKADEAFRIGLINKVVKQEFLMPEVKLLAAKIASKPINSVKSIIELLNAPKYYSSEQCLNKESDLFAKLTNTDDFKEGTSAFLEKRKPDFKNR